MSKAVLDASAILALLNQESGSDEIAKTVPRAAVSAVNLSEVIAKLSDLRMPESEIRVVLDGLAFEIHPFDKEMAYIAGSLRPSTQRAGLSFGDRACLALGIKLSLPVLTADKSWQSLAVPVRIRVIR